MAAPQAPQQAQAPNYAPKLQSIYDSLCQICGQLDTLIGLTRVKDPLTLPMVIGMNGYNVQRKGYKHFRIHPAATGTIIADAGAGPYSIALTAGTPYDTFLPEGTYLTAATAVNVVLVWDDLS